MNGPVGFGDRGLTDHNQQRLQLQIGFADHELGKLFAHMRANGTFNQALIAITADHGIAFEVGVKDRRTVTSRNIDEIAPVPLFIKAPGQTPRRRPARAYAQHDRRGADDRRHPAHPDALPGRRPLGLLERRCAAGASCA